MLSKEEQLLDKKIWKQRIKQCEVWKINHHLQELKQHLTQNTRPRGHFNNIWAQLLKIKRQRTSYFPQIRKIKIDENFPMQMQNMYYVEITYQQQLKISISDQKVMRQWIKNDMKMRLIKIRHEESNIFQRQNAEHSFWQEINTKTLLSHQFQLLHQNLSEEILISKIIEYYFL